jgi:hypothetical protein
MGNQAHRRRRRVVAHSFAALASRAAPDAETAEAALAVLIAERLPGIWVAVKLREAPKTDVAH